MKGSSKQPSDERRKEMYNATHDIYGKSIWAEKTDETIVRHYIKDFYLIVETYNRRTTVSTYEVQLLPRSLS